MYRNVHINLIIIIKNMMLLKCCTQYVNKSGKLSSGHSTEKDSLHSKPKEGQCQRMLELLHNLCSFHMLARLRSKVFQARLQQYVNQELPDVQPGFQRGRGTRDQIANNHWIIEKAREFTSTSASLTTLKPLCGYNKL